MAKVKSRFFCPIPTSTPGRRPARPGTTGRYTRYAIYTRYSGQWAVYSWGLLGAVPMYPHAHGIHTQNTKGTATATATATTATITHTAPTALGQVGGERETRSVLSPLLSADADACTAPAAGSNTAACGRVPARPLPSPLAPVQPSTPAAGRVVVIAPQAPYEGPRRRKAVLWRWQPHATPARHQERQRLHVALGRALRELLPRRRLHEGARGARAHL
jgi:hypothetical protein